MKTVLILLLLFNASSFGQTNRFLFHVTNAQFSTNNFRVGFYYPLSNIIFLGFETESISNGTTAIKNTGATLHFRTNPIKELGGINTYLFGSGFYGQNQLGDSGRLGMGIRYGITSSMGFHCSVEKTWKNFQYTTTNYTDDALNISYGITFGF